ncbi:aminotransferase class I/II-fold pyridoxal phosphate-dependent enzyme [Sphingobacterium spiritivorum]|uniref:aminotransferase class I/II-fold pyridoxal phosphate-dependent enzyme n=1 Tax=Sphingobacterium spiritivorum TaxID=258 RepID=UPI003DA48A28
MDTFRHLNQPTGRQIQLHDKEYLFFGGTAYLSLLNDPAYMELFITGVRKLGLNNGTSRNNNVQLGIFDEAEKAMSRRFGFEDAILVSGGYLAAQMVVKNLAGEGEFLYAPNSHPALWLSDNPGIRGEFADWAAHTVAYINSSERNSFVLISNTLDNMKPERYDFKAFRYIDPDKKVILILDDSHGIGVINRNRTSVAVEELVQENLEVILLASLAKGMGTDAGVIFASPQRIAALRSSTFYTGASPSSPASMYALLHGEEIYHRQFDQLQQNIALFGRLTGSRLSHIPGFSVFTSARVELYHFLLQRGFVVSSFPYPLATDPLLNRIVICSHHTAEDLQQLADHVNEFTDQQY